MLRRNHFLKKILLLSLLSFFLFSFTNSEHPFNYDLHIHSIPGTSGKVMVCMHGKGGDYSIAQKIKEFSKSNDTLISFNFPDHNINTGQKTLAEIKYGTVDELLPAIYVLRKLIVDDGYEEVNLYGYSAGAGALINVLSLLNGNRFDGELKKLHIEKKEKGMILAAIQKGHIILDTPLKSLREIVAFRGPQCEVAPFEKRYRENQMEPIDALQGIDRLALNVWIHFQNPDEVLSNRDDDLFIERMMKYNSLGKTVVIKGYDFGHKMPHPTLWEEYHRENRMYTVALHDQKYIVGIKIRTSNKDHKEDGSLLWDRFKREKIFDHIQNKVNQNTYAVYMEYDGDYTKPYSYLIGCEVEDLSHIPEGLCGVTVKNGKYAIFPTKGTFPMSLIQAWQTIWQAPLERAYHTDYEIYPPEFNFEESLGLQVCIGIAQ